MHNLVTAGNINKIQSEANLRLIDEAVSYNAYSYWLGANDLVYQSGTVTFTAPSTTNPPYWTFYEGSAGVISTYVRRHREWRNGYFSVILHWMADESGTDAKWRISVDPVPLKPTTATLPTASTVAATLTSTSSTAMMVNEVIDSTLNVKSKISALHSGIFFTIGKIKSPSGDTMTVDRKVFGVELVYHEKSKQSGSYNP